MTKQMDLFGEVLPEHCRVVNITPRTPPPEARKLARASDPITSHEAAREVVESGSAKSHCEQILELLTIRKASSLELSKIALKYTSRLSDLKAAGHNVVSEKTRNHETGKAVWMYSIPGADE